MPTTQAARLPCEFLLQGSIKGSFFYGILISFQDNTKWFSEITNDEASEEEAFRKLFAASEGLFRKGASLDFETALFVLPNILGLTSVGFSILISMLSSKELAILFVGEVKLKKADDPSLVASSAYIVRLAAYFFRFTMLQAIVFFGALIVKKLNKNSSTFIVLRSYLYENVGKFPVNA